MRFKLAKSNIRFRLPTLRQSSSYLLPSIISIEFIDGDTMITVRMDEKPPSYLTQKRDEHDKYTK